MYTGSHLKLILTILLVPCIFIFLIASDFENRNQDSEIEITVQEVKIDNIENEVSLIEENKIKFEVETPSILYYLPLKYRQA